MLLHAGSRPDCRGPKRLCSRRSTATCMTYSTDLDFRSELSPRQAAVGAERGTTIPASPLQQRRRKGPFMIGVAVSYTLHGFVLWHALCLPCMRSLRLPSVELTAQ